MVAVKVRKKFYVARTPNEIIDVEMQCGEEASLGRRMRYYQSMVDSRVLEKGQSYSELQPLYIIFICTKDPYGKGLPMHHFEMTCLEDGTLNAGSSVHFIVANASAAELCDDDKLRSLLSYVSTDTPDGKDGLTMEIDNAVKSTQTKRIYFDSLMDPEMDMRVKTQYAFEKGKKEGVAEGLAEGLAEGKAEGEAKAIAELQELIASGVSAEEAIAQMSQKTNQ